MSFRKKNNVISQVWKTFVVTAKKEEGRGITSMYVRDERVERVDKASRVYKCVPGQQLKRKL